VLKTASPIQVATMLLHREAAGSRRCRGKARGKAAERSRAWPGGAREFEGGALIEMKEGEALIIMR